MTFLVTGHDGSDEGATARRAAARSAHLERARRHATEGVLRFAAALVDDNGQMIGSTMVVELPTRETLQRWLDEEPYVLGDVWRKVDVCDCRIAPMFAREE